MFDRLIFEKIIDFIEIDQYPKLPCPYCNEISLTMNFDTLNYEIVSIEHIPLLNKRNDERLDSVKDTFEESKFLGVLHAIGVVIAHSMAKPAKFVSFFSCEHCNKSVSATGSMILNKDEDIDVSSIKVEYFSPPIPIFKMSNSIPIEVKTEIIQSFNHFHSDLSSSGAKLRRAIERMCHNFGFKEKNLHFTLSSFEKKFSVEGELLHSIKLLGNEATHADLVDESDLLNGFEIFNYVLKLYDRISLEKIAKEKSIELREKFIKKPLSISK